MYNLSKSLSLHRCLFISRGIHVASSSCLRRRRRSSGATIEQFIVRLTWSSSRALRQQGCRANLIMAGQRQGALPSRILFLDDLHKADALLKSVIVRFPKLGVVAHLEVCSAQLHLRSATVGGFGLSSANRPLLYLREKGKKKQRGHRVGGIYRQRVTLMERVIVRQD